MLTDHLRRFKEAVCEAAGREVVFGTDTYPPSFSLLVGHNYLESLTWSGYTSPLISHAEIFILATFASNADLFCRWNSGLEETDALQLVYWLYGYDHLGLPQTPEALGVAHRTLKCASKSCTTSSRWNYGGRGCTTMVRFLRTP